MENDKHLPISGPDDTEVSPIEAWERDILANHRVDRATEIGVLGVGRQFEKSDPIQVFVGNNTDTTDKTIYPDVVDGVPVIYTPTGLPVMLKTDK